MSPEVRACLELVALAESEAMHAAAIMRVYMEAKTHNRGPTAEELKLLAATVPGVRVGLYALLGAG